jgi:hypothetical protein
VREKDIEKGEREKSFMCVCEREGETIGEGETNERETGKWEREGERVIG